MNNEYNKTCISDYRPYSRYFSRTNESLPGMNPRVPKIGLLKYNPNNSSAGVCNHKQTCATYPLTPVYVDYGLYVNQCGPPLPP
jgi:hypothetical protein